MVWRDDNRSGVQDAGESPARGVSIQLLNVDGEVVTSTVSSPSGRYVFDNLQAGTYSVRFAGVPEEFRLTPAGVGDELATDSDPDYSGVTPPSPWGWGNPMFDHWRDRRGSGGVHQSDDRCGDHSAALCRG